jgi:hypothetical protein
VRGLEEIGDRVRGVPAEAHQVLDGEDRQDDQVVAYRVFGCRIPGEQPVADPEPGQRGEQDQQGEPVDVQLCRNRVLARDHDRANQHQPAEVSEQGVLRAGERRRQRPRQQEPDAERQAIVDRRREHGSDELRSGQQRAQCGEGGGGGEDRGRKRRLAFHGTMLLNDSAHRAAS